MIIDAQQGFPSRLQQRFDVAIVGAGPAGITLAEALKGSGLSVCVVESGGAEVEPAVQALAEGEVQAPSPAVEENYLSLHSQRRFGGTGTLWGGYCREMEALDFEQRNLPGLHGWPISKADIEAFYPRQLIDHQQPDRALEDSGLQLKYFQRSVYPFNLLHIDSFKDADDLLLLSHATVVDFVYHGGRQLQALRLKNMEGDEALLTARYFVLAGGGAGTVKLLLNADTKVQQAMGTAFFNVGRYFMEHPHFQFYAPPGMLWLKQDIAEQVFLDKTYKPCLTLPDELIRAEKLLNFALLLSAPITEQSGWAGAKWNKPDFGHWLDGGNAGEYYTLSFRAEQLANHDSYIDLSGKRDALGKRNLRLHWRMSAYDGESLLKSFDLITQQLGIHGAGRLKLVLDRQHLWQTMVGGGHLMGTTRMSATAEQGVVDANCRVFGLDNLYIAGSSIFASGGFANPTATLMALASRLGQHLKAVIS